MKRIRQYYDIIDIGGKKKAEGVSLNVRNTGFGKYVAGIGGLNEKDLGGSSGWMYSVNGSYPNTACSNYDLSDGDVIVFSYTVKKGDL